MAMSSSVEPAADQLRFRKSGRPATIVEEDAGQQPNASRRASSFLSDSSIDSVFLRSSTESLLRPRATGDHRDEEEMHQEPTLWHSAPLLFALIPAITGLVFKRGSIVITDAILLVLAAIYLNWCLVTPWIWYHNAQTIKISKPPIPETVLEDDDSQHNSEPEPVEDCESKEETANAEPAKVQREKSTQDLALQELQMHELFALAMCFAGPLLGAYVLHLVRLSLSHFGDELVSNLHLTIFVLAAELRPLRHCLKMVQARSLHLQRVVREDPHAIAKVNNTLVQDNNRRIAEIEQNLAAMKSSVTTTADSAANATAESFKRTQATMQSQIDALNRAVRRYEKRSTAQTIQNEARLQDLDYRLKDALALAAAAASYEPNNLKSLLEWIATATLAPFYGLWRAITYPFRLGYSLVVTFLLQIGLVQNVRRKKSSKRQLGSAKARPDTYGFKVPKKG